LECFHKNVDGKDFERFRDVHVRRNPEFPDNPHHGETSINIVGAGVGLKGTKLIDDKVQGKKRNQPDVTTSWRHQREFVAILVVEITLDVA
jgi:hypothetical protein